MVKATDSIKTALDDIRVALDKLWMCAYGLDKELAAGLWRTDEPPRDGTEILAHFDDDPDYVHYITWAGKCWWHCGDGDSCSSDGDPDRWAHVNIPGAAARHKTSIT